MPDLQSELTKVLTQKQFDDDDNTIEAPAEMTMSRRVWEYIKAHPTSSAKEISDGTSLKNSVVANAVNKFYVRGIVVRRESRHGYTYTTSVDEYPVFDRAAHGRQMIKLAVEARKKNAKAARATKPAKLQVQHKPAGFDVDAIIGNLNVLQAKQLLVRLKEVFGV